MNTLPIAIMVGSALVLGLFAAYRLFNELGHADATYRDRPPLGFRLLWPLINVMGNTVSPLYGTQRRASCLKKLRQGGQEYALTPQQFLGGKVTGLLIGGGAALMLLIRPLCT